MHGELRMTTAVARVLRAFLENPTTPRYGFDLMRVTGLPSGTLYPILARLERLAWVSSRNEEVDPLVEGRPARRFYLLTDGGLATAGRELAALSRELTPPPAALRSELSPRGGTA
jgi:PadR family transcriptional regulator, regulatory protein PadR